MHNNFKRLVFLIVIGIFGVSVYSSFVQADWYFWGDNGVFSRSSQQNKTQHIQTQQRRTSLQEQNSQTPNNQQQALQQPQQPQQTPQQNNQTQQAPQSSPQQQAPQTQGPQPLEPWGVDKKCTKENNCIRIPISDDAKKGMKAGKGCTSCNKGAKKPEDQKKQHANIHVEGINATAKRGEDKPYIPQGLKLEKVKPDDPNDKNYILTVPKQDGIPKERKIKVKQGEIVRLAKYADKSGVDKRVDLRKRGGGVGSDKYKVAVCGPQDRDKPECGGKKKVDGNKQAQAGKPQRQMTKEPPKEQPKEQKSYGDKTGVGNGGRPQQQTSRIQHTKPTREQVVSTLRRHFGRGGGYSKFLNKNRLHHSRRAMTYYASKIRDPYANRLAMRYVKYKYRKHRKI